MSLARSVLFVLVLACACGGKDEATPSVPPASAEPRVDGKTIAEWCVALESPNTCRLAAETLTKVGLSDPRVLPAFHKAIASPDASVRRAAAGALAKIGEPAVGPTAALIDSADQATRDGAGDALAGMGAAGLRRLVNSLGESSPRVSTAASAALQRAGDAAVGPLTAGLTLGSASVRLPAAKCLAALKAAPALASALGDPATRDAAADGLMSIGPEAIPVLQAASADPRRRDAANDLMARLRGFAVAESVKALEAPGTRAKAAADLAAMGDAALPALIAGLGGGSDAIRDACADILRSRAENCAREVAPLLESQRAAARTAAARLLLDAGADGVEPLVAALGSERVEVRESVVVVLREGGAGIRVLIKATAAGVPKARATAGKALAALGDAAVPALAEAVFDGDPAERTAAIDALGDIGPPAFPALRSLLAAPDRALRESVGDLLARVGAPAVPTLIDALKGADVAAQDAAARSLVRIGAPAAPLLVAAAGGGDAAFAARARDVLVRLGASSFGEFVKMAASTDAAVRLAAVRALGSLAADLDEAVPPLATALDDADADVRLEAVRGLAAAGPRAKPAIDALGKVMRGKSPRNRIEAAVAVSRCGAPNAALPFLLNGMKDADAAIRALSADALVRAGIPETQSRPPLMEALKDAAPSVRIAAIQALVAAGAKGDAVVAAFARCAVSLDDAERAAARAAIPQVTDLPIADVLQIGGAMRGDRIRRQRGREAGSNSKVDKAVAAALDWLARHQSPDGHWGCADFDALCKLNRCDGPGLAQFDAGVTALALLAFLGAGESSAYGPHQDVVARGLAYLRGAQGADGRVGPRTGGAKIEHTEFSGFGRVSFSHTSAGDGLMYVHAVATVALCEAYMLAGDPEVGAAATKAVDFVLKAKNPYLAWRYSVPPDGDNDTSITCWMAWALATAHAAVIKGEPRALKDAVAWIDKMTEPEFGRTGYQQRGGSSARTNEMMQKFPAELTESLTAMGVMVRVLAGHTPNDDEFLVKSANLLAKRLPQWDVDKGTIDFYYWFWGSTALRQVGGPQWAKWSDAMKTALLGAQRADPHRDEAGSWDPVDAWSSEGGRIYSTAMCCMTLESFWRMDRLGEWK